MFQVRLCPDPHQSLTALQKNSVLISTPTMLTMYDSTPAIVFPLFLGVGTGKSHSKNMWRASQNIKDHKTFREELKQELAHLLCASGKDLTSESPFSPLNCPNILHEN